MVANCLWVAAAARYATALARHSDGPAQVVAVAAPQRPCLGETSGPAPNLGVADRGIREGILRSLMARDGWIL